MPNKDFFSQPYLSALTNFSNRPEMIRRIELGETDHLDFHAKVFKGGSNRNNYRFKAEDLPRFAGTFEGRPFLRNHDEDNIESRDGTIMRSFVLDGTIYQDIRLTTRKGMLSLVEGQIDRFSIGWFYEKVTCSICLSDFRTCQHWPGREYPINEIATKCEVIFEGVTGKETSAVNVPAVEGTSILSYVKIDHKESNIMNEPSLKPEPEIPYQTLSGTVLLAEHCKFLLEAALSASRLPEVTQTRIQRQFGGQVFQPAALQATIEEARSEIAALTASANILGPARISNMSSSEDQLRAAVDDMFGVPRNTGLENIKPARLSGIRELYLMLTGDYNLHGGYYPNEARLAITTDFSGLVKNALNKAVANQWEAMGRAGYDWWKSIVKVEHFESVNTITGILTGTVGALSTVAEQGEYTELPIGDSPETASFVKYGNYIPLTLELIDRDETRKLKQYPIEMANAAIRNISSLIAAVFTSNGAVGPTMADTGALFNNTAVTSAGGHANLLTTALSATQWDVVTAAVYNQPMLIKNTTGYYGTGSKMAIEPRFCLVPRALRKTAFDAFLNAWDVTANVHAENLLKGNVVPLAVPEWTDANDWAAVCDPALVPGIVVGERFGLMPEIFIGNHETDPAVFMNDEHRLKVRHFLAVLVQDFRPLHKSNV